MAGRPSTRREPATRAVNLSALRRGPGPSPFVYCFGSRASRHSPAVRRTEAAHAAELRDRLTAYQEFGTRLGRYSARSAVSSVTPKRAVHRGEKDRNLAIRRWAEEQGLPIKARGKISDTVIAKCDAAHANAA